MNSKNNLHKHALTMILTIFMSFMFFAVGVFADEEPVAEPGGDTPQTYLVTVNGGTGGNSYTENTVVDITATVPDGQVFVNWTTESNGVYFVDSVSQTTSFIMPANEVIVIANFEDTSDPGINVMAAVLPANPLPTIAIDYANETLTGFTPGETYTINGITYADISASLAIDSSWFNTSLTIIHKANATYSDSPEQSLSIPSRPEAPTGLGTSDETSFKANDGLITGLNTGTNYQYSTDQINWTDISGAEQISSLAAGTYYVRTKSGDLSFASDIATVTVSPGPFAYPLTLTTGGQLQYNGNEAIAYGVLSPGSYSFSGNTLTLTNVNYTTSATMALDLTAVLAVTFNINGTNTITSAYSGTNSTYGIATTGTITIEGTGSLAVTGGTSLGGNSIGVIGNVTVNSGNFSAQGNTSATSSSPTVNVAKYNWTVGISGSQYPISTPNFTGATSISITTLTGVNPETTTYNKYVGFDDIDIRYSLANGDILESISYGNTTLIEDEDYSISGNTVTFPYEYISTLPNAGATLTFNTSGTTDPTVTITFNNVPATNAYGLVLTDGGKLQINNVDATAADLGGGSYTYSGGTLTLNNVNFITSAAVALDVNAVNGLNIVINGSNSFTSVFSGAWTTYGIDANTALTISGTGSLTVTAGTSTLNSSGIDVEYEYGILTLNGGNVIASGQSSAVRGNVTINMPSYSWTADDSGGTYPDNALTVTHLSSQNTIAITTLTAVSPMTVDNVNIFSTPADIPITYSLLNGTTLDSITNGENTLTENTHYTVASNIVTIKGSYLGALSVGTQTLTFNTSGTTDPTVTLNVINRNPAYTYLDISTLSADPNIAVTSGQTVVVVGTKGSSASPANFGLTFNIEAGGNVIWDDAVFTTSVEYAVRINGYGGTKGNFELKSGEINAKRTSYSVYALSNNANLTITGGTVSASGDSFTYGISNNTGASLTINDGLISVNSSFWSYGIWNQGTVLINDGIIAATGNGSDAFTNNGTVTVKGDATVIGITNISAGTVPVTFSENAVSILYDKTMTAPVFCSLGGLTLANGGTAVWNTVGGKHGISWKKGTNTGFIEIDGVTTTQNAVVDATIDISFIDSQTMFSVTGSKTLTVTGENTSADFFLQFRITSGSEVIWDGAAYVSTETYAVGLQQIESAGKFTMNSGLIAGTVLINSINADIGGTIIAEDPFTGPTIPTYINDYVIITLPNPIGTYTKGTNTDLTVEPANATAIWDIQGGKHGVSWVNGTNAGFLEISGASVSNPPAPEPENDDNNSGNSGSPDVAMPPRNEHKDETDDEDTDDSNKESNTNLKVNGEMSDTSVAMPVEPGDKTADVKVDGKTVETYSLTAAEAIADSEVKEAFVSETGAIAAVTTGGNVIAGANSTESLNSASTIAALEAAIEEAAATVTEDGEPPLITITAGQEVTGVSDNTLEKIIAVSEGSGVDTQIQKRQYSENENGQIDELIYRITIPVASDNIQDIRLGAEFSTAVVEASEIAFEKTFGNTDCAGFALTQKDSFGTEATIQVRMSAIGFEAEAGDIVYVAIFNPTTGRYTQVEGRVGESGFITFKTDKSGVVVISATPFTK